MTDEPRRLPGATRLPFRHICIATDNNVQDLRMAHFVWSDDLDTRIPVIDRQHRRIAEYLNKLQVAIEAADKSRVEEVLEALVDYTLTHFAFEEEVMEMVDHPTIGAHRKTHRLFAARIERFRQSFRAGEDVARELGATLRSWLVNHIRHDDGDYASAVRELIRAEPAGGLLKRPGAGG